MFTDETEVINIIGSEKLRLEGSLKIKDFTKLKSINLEKLELTELEISCCSHLIQINLSELSKLTSLSVTGCLKLNKLDCSNNSKLNYLEVSDLTELNCSNTSIVELSLNLCPYITKLDCSNNSKLISLDVSNCFKLKFIDCSQSNLTSLDLSYCSKSITINPPDLDIIRKKENIKNILIVGRTGSGRTTLANVLTGSDDFRESGYAVSEKKGFNKKVFKCKEVNYCVVDTVGFEDTNLTTKKVLYKIADGIYSMPEGISRVLFVVDGRFLPEKMSSLNLISDVFFDIDILDYVTIVRTKFSGFRNKYECDKDKRIIYEEYEKIAEIVNSRDNIIHVDNPSINIVKYDVDDDAQIDFNKKAREKSRKILLDYLEKICQEDREDREDREEYFKIKTWDKLRDKITKYVDNEELEVNPQRPCLIL
ncbi:hypothetical protein RhiirA5_402576 [Rhizophagus irregularis]|uniref:AIG1-type G domain-containing protein n=1 Tax=Rhizophagus irregularis TaxID=588596 RepID=A0A2I1EN70_9GLOM|nr:hypothetical protein RhiirA5_402576 [Rhizophagus irregularis]PKY23569.1 hypothetical protein RhiirB3_506345 [Rhizophagus irregularis]CAB4493587.1 unnamed protein product [Rhizophagus irregularis]CAB5208530.1 unnamed protein product [Rhizophagus irregularis]CAB5370821.1 unnamed protein product [Rhizophagus irregularis]